MIAGAITAQAQRTSWMQGNEVVVLTPGEPASIFALPQPNDPNAGADQYSGGAATTSAYVQLDDLGCILFFAVDGDLYDRNGYRIAQGGDLGCGNTAGCLLTGSTELIVAPVPGRCGHWYLFHSIAVAGSQADPVLHVSVLDMTLQNPAFPNDPERRGRVLDDTDLDAAGYDLMFAWPYANPIAVDLGAPFADLWSAGERCLHMDAVRSEATGRTFLFATSGEVIARYELTSSSILLLGSQPVDLAGAVLNPTARPRVAKGELEAVAVGSTVRVAFSITLYSDQVMPPPPDYNAFLVHVAAYDAALPTVPRTFHENLHIGDLLITAPPAPTNLGTTVAYPGAGGVEFTADGALVYWCRSLADHGQPYWDGLHHLGYFDWATLTVNSFPTIALLPTVDSELELAPAPDGNGLALYVAGTDDQGNAWLSALSGPDDPNTATWLPQAITLGQASLCADPSLGWNNVQDRYHLLQAQGHNDASLERMSDPMCCQELQDMTCTVAYAAPVGAGNWTPTDNPFCDKPVVRICEELRLPTGAHITAQDLTFAFSADAALVIEPGASLTCTNCTFTTACVGELWKGIEVTGTITQHQYGGSHPTYQGELVLLNSQVWKAEVGILTAERLGGSINGFTSGGVVRCTNTTFRNCRTAVQFMPYQGSQPGTGVPVRNRSSFRECTFSIDNNYPVALDFRHHAYLWHVDGIPFLGCDFRNDRLTETNSHERGHGIYSLDAHYEVREKCNVIPQYGQECPVGSYTPSSFSGLDHGVHALTSLTTRAFVVDRSTFSANVCGVFASGVVGYRVTRNSFELGNSVVTALTNPDEDYWEEYHRGLYSVRSYGFMLEDNTLNQGGAYPYTEGIVTGYTGAHNDVVRRNTATGLERAFIGEGICAETTNGGSDWLGLQLLCNTNSGNVTNFWDRKVIAADPQFDQPFNSMRTFQGHPPLNNGVPTRPGANVFDQSCVFPEMDYERTSTYAVLNYYFGQTAADDPLCYTTGYVAKQQLPAYIGDPCPARNYSPRGVRSQAEAGQVKAALDADKLAYGNTRYLYEQLIDGGNTDDVVQEIMSTWPSDAWELRDYLLAKSPFLSVEALKEMVDKNVMPEAMVAEVLIANPEATQQERFMDWLQEESGHPLPGYLYNSVVASWEEKTYRTTLHGTMAYYHASMTQHTHDLLDHFRADTTYEDVDSLRWGWQQLRTPAARYAEALTYLQQGNHTAATALVENITVEHELKGADVLERQRMLDVIAFCQQVAVAGRTLAELTTAEVDALEAIIDGAQDKPGLWAQNLLCFAYGRCVAPLTGGEIGPRMMEATPMEHETPAHVLFVHPNPASAWVAVDYTVGDTKGAWLLVTDVTGRRLEQRQLTALRGQFVWDVRHAQPGVYSVALVVRDEVLATERVIVIVQP